MWQHHVQTQRRRRHSDNAHVAGAHARRRQQLLDLPPLKLLQVVGTRRRLRGHGAKVAVVGLLVFVMVAWSWRCWERDVGGDGGRRRAGRIDCDTGLGRQRAEQRDRECSRVGGAANREGA